MGRRSAVLDLQVVSSRRARKEFDRLVAEALLFVLAAGAGDVGAVYDAHRLLNRAVGLMLEHRWDTA